jgi:putative SOS response-associated peptidase YedK
MCGRFVLKTDLARLLDTFRASVLEPHEFRPRYNIAPSQEIPVVVSVATGDRSVQWMKWGLIPSWSGDKSMASSLINARAETAAEKPSFRAPFRSRRCIVPATGFYEWKSGGGKRKVPHLIEVDGQPLFAMAGLWDRWEVRDLSGNKSGEIIETFSILTVDAIPELQWLHHRMPRIVSGAELEQWLDPASDPAELTEWIARPPEVRIRHRAVTRDVNSPQNDSPELLDTPPETDLFGNWIED